MTRYYEIQLYLSCYAGYGNFLTLNRHQNYTFYIVVQVILSASVVVTGYFV